MNEKVINTLLNHKNIFGVKVHKINNGIIRCFEIVSNVIKSISELENINNSGIYFLINDDNQSLYIGQSQNILERIQTHNRDQTKSFNKFIAFVSDSNDFSRTYIDYLEYYFINEAKFDSFEFKLENESQRNKSPNVTDFELPIIEEAINNIKLLLLNIGIDYINRISNLKILDVNDQILTYKKSMLIYKDGEFKMLKGSLIPMINDKAEKLSLDMKSYSSSKRGLEKLELIYKHWLDEGIINQVDNNTYELLQTVSISSISKAAQMASGHYAQNGWVCFKNSLGKTIGEIYR